MEPLAPCIHPARQGLTAVDGGGWGRVRLLPGAAQGGFHSVGVLMVSGVHWVTASHVPCGFLTARASQHLFIIAISPHHHFSPSNQPHILFGRGGGHRRDMGPSWATTC
jgi:hypothetical protein